MTLVHGGVHADSSRHEVEGARSAVRRRATARRARVHVTRTQPRERAPEPLHVTIARDGDNLVQPENPPVRLAQLHQQIDDGHIGNVSREQAPSSNRADGFVRRVAHHDTPDRSGVASTFDTVSLGNVSLIFYHPGGTVVGFGTRAR